MPISEKTRSELIEEIESLRKENLILIQQQSKLNVDNLIMLQNAVDTSGDIIFITNLDGIITYINPEFTRVYGFSSEEVIGKTTPRILKSGELDQSKYECFWETILDKKIIKEELINRTKNGQFVTVEGSTSAIVNEHDEIIGFLSVQRDISDKKLIEEKLRANQHMLSLVLDSFPGEVFWKDRNSIFLGCNNAFAKSAGFESSKEIIGKSDYDMPWASYGADNFIVDDKYVMESRQKKFGIIEARLQADGQVRWMEANKLPLVNRDENVIGVMGTANDITERVNAQKSLKESESTLRIITDNMYDLVARLDTNGFYIDVTPSYFRALGYTKEDLIGKYAFDSLHPDDVEKTHNTFLSGLQKGLPQETEYRVKNKYGDYVWVHTIGRFLFTEDGKADGVVISSRDITARKKIEEKLFNYQAELENKIDERTLELKNTINRLKNEILEREQIEIDLVKSREEFKTLADNLPDIIIRYDHNLKPSYENIKTELTDFLRFDDIDRKNAVSRINPESSQLYDLITRTFQTGEIQKTELDFSNNGTNKYYEIQIVPEYSINKKIDSVLAVIRDLTERKKIEEQVQIALMEKDVLVREIHHRVKNNLQSIIYLIDMQIEESNDAKMTNVLKELQSKVKTMSMIHEQLYKSQNLSKIDFEDYLKNLLASLTEMFRSNRMIEIKFRTTEHLADIRTVLPCGMIINELITNSIKYAFPESFSRGEDWVPTINVLFEKNKDSFSLIIEDNGIGLPKNINWKESNSLGLKLVNIWATYQLGGSIVVKNSIGTRFEIKFNKGYEQSN